MQIPDDRFARIAADGNQPLLRAFAHKSCDSAVHIDIIEIRTARLRHAGTGRIHEFKQCLVTQHHRIIGKLRHDTIKLSVLRNGDRVQQSSHLINGQPIGKRAHALRGLYLRGHIIDNNMFVHCETMKRMNAGQPACLASR